jgi:preprotein translocase subunit SecF
MGDDLDDIDFNLPSEGDSDNDDDVPKSLSKKNNKKRSQESEEEEAAAEGEAQVEGEEGNSKKKKKKSKKANTAEPTVKEFESLEAVATHFDSLFRKEVCLCVLLFLFFRLLILFICAIQQNSEYTYIMMRETVGLEIYSC